MSASPGRRPRTLRRVVLALLSALLAAVLAWAALKWTRSASEQAVTAPAAADTAGTGFRSVRLWFVSRSGDSLVSEDRDLIEQAALHDRVASLVDELARGPEQASAALAPLPAGTAVQNVYLDDSGLLTLDLTPPFRNGFRGGAGAEELAVGALMRTLAGELPRVTRVQIVCGGSPLGSLHGHLPLDRPLEMSQWP